MTDNLEARVRGVVGHGLVAFLLFCGICHAGIKHRGGGFLWTLADVNAADYRECPVCQSVNRIPRLAMAEGDLP